VNPAFVDVFGYDAETVVGESLNQFIVPADSGSQAVDFDRRTAHGKVNYATVTRRTASGSREFLYRGIPYDRDDDRQFGFAIYTDITEQRRLQRHLQVLHRVLRHNLRNELTIVMGIAASLRETVDDPQMRSQIDLIHDHAAVLDDVSEKAHTVASVLKGTDGTTTLPVEPLVSEVVGRCRSRYPRATITTQIDPEVEVSTNPALGAAVEELVENGVVHNGGDPTVHVETEVRDGEVRMTVADDGPGIPAADRAVVFDDGDITDLQHGSGLGLWLVRWVAEAAGGHVAHERRDDWTAVTLHLCPADADGDAPVSRGSAPRGNATD
jgi:PAS domain S-box-containing protein